MTQISLCFPVELHTSACSATLLERIDLYREFNVFTGAPPESNKT